MAGLTSARNTLTAEAAGLTQLADALGDNFVQAVDILAAAQGRVIVSGMGKSGHIGNKIAAAMARPAHRPLSSIRQKQTWRFGHDYPR